MVQTYQRNQLAFCRSYIAQIKDFKSSPSSLIGTGYDEALQDPVHARLRDERTPRVGHVPGLTNLTLVIRPSGPTTHPAFALAKPSPQ